MSNSGEERPKATVVLGTPDSDVDSEDPAPSPRRGADTFLLHPSLPEPLDADAGPPHADELPTPADILSSPTSDIDSEPLLDAPPAPESSEPGAPAEARGAAEPRDSPPWRKAEPSEPRLPDYVYGELKAAVQDALGKFGTTGELSFGKDSIRLSRSGGVAESPLGRWVQSWPALAEEVRVRRAAELARSLASQRFGDAQPRRRAPIHIDLKLIGALAAILAASAYFIFFDSGFTADEEAASVEQREPSRGGETDPVERSARVCAATRARVHQGGSVTVADIDGWVIDISLFSLGSKAPLLSHPGLKEFVEDPLASEGSRFIWKPESDLGTLDTSDTRVRMEAMALRGGEKRSVQGITLTFGGTLVDPYFREKGRARFHRIAHALSEKLEATHAAVYARCDGDKHHAMGSWFRGEDTAAATTSLLYFMGTFASPRHIAKPFVTAPGSDDVDRYLAFGNIRNATKPVDRAALATVVGSEGGMATGKPDGPVYITFPFRDGNRASRVSRSLARVVGLGH